MPKLWGGRFGLVEMKNDVLKFTSSLNVDIALAKYDAFATKVHASMLLKCGIISSKEERAISSALDELLEKIGRNEWEPEAEIFEDVHSAVQDYVEKKFPDAAKKMHTARSRNEQVVNDVRLYAKDNVTRITRLISALQKKMVLLADKNSAAIIPGYTHLNRAQPVLFAHLVLSYAEGLERDKERLYDAGKRLDICVMGSGAIAGSRLALDRNFTAKKLKFAAISANSIDSVSDRDFIAEVLSCLAIIATRLSRISEDMILYSTPEFGIIDMGAEYCTGSSLMPQKKNPDVLELVRGKAAGVIAAANSLLILMKSLPASYNRDLQEDKKPFFESIETVTQSLEIMASLFGTIKLKRDAAKEILEDEFIYATDVAEYLVGKGVAFKDAHDIVGSIVKHCSDRNLNISDLSLSELKSFSVELGEDVYTLLNAETSVNNKKTPGSTNPVMVKKEIARWKKRL